MTCPARLGPSPLWAIQLYSRIRGSNQMPYPYPPDRTHLRPGKKAVAGPEMLPTSESPVLAEAGARAA
jgi:hypothetical protein